MGNTMGCPFATSSAIGGEEAAANAREAIANNDVIVFGRANCNYCSRALRLLGALSSKVAYLDCTHAPNDGILHEVARMTGHTTVPVIFIFGKFMGGYSDIEALHRQGKLAPLIEKGARKL